MEPKDLILVSTLPFLALNLGGSHRKFMSINRNMGTSSHLYGLLEFPENIHGILSISPPLTGPWQGKEHGKLDLPSSSSWLLLILQLWARVSAIAITML